MGHRLAASKLPEVPLVAFTIAEFCNAHRLSQTTYFKMQKQGIGPREIKIGTRKMISIEAAAAWRREREAIGAGNTA